MLKNWNPRSGDAPSGSEKAADASVSPGAKMTKAWQEKNKTKEFTSGPAPMGAGKKGGLPHR
jgi:hypothetical protein